MSANPVTVSPATEAGVVEQAGALGAGSRLGRKVLLGLAIIVVLFVGTYALAWYKAQSLATTFLADADASYSAGNYIEALTGYEEFDQERNAYVTYGGYMKVVRMWSDPRAWPRPAGVERAQARIDEILQQRLTIEEAEGFIQANIGKQNPYFGIVYLRLGELYEQEGDLDSAKQIYSEIEELFPGESDLIARANEHLARLGSS